MSILIKDMKMPKNCGECLFKHLSPTGESIVCGLDLSTVPWESRPFDCPLIEVSKHGRLIDADTLLNLLNHCMFPSDIVTTTAVKMATNWIKDAPTIIETEED